MNSVTILRSVWWGDFYRRSDAEPRRRPFLSNHALYGGGVSTNGSVAVSFSNLRIIGNEANASGSPSGGFAYFNTGLISSTFVRAPFGNKSSNLKNGVYRFGLTPASSIAPSPDNEASALGGIAILFSGDSSPWTTVLSGATRRCTKQRPVNAGKRIGEQQPAYDPSQSLGGLHGSEQPEFRSVVRGCQRAGQPLRDRG